MTTHRAGTICVLEILKEYSDADHVLQMQDIIAKLKSIYGIAADRRTVYGAIEFLKTLGYDISCYSDNGVGYYLISRSLETSEIRLLMDSVYSNPSIPVRQSEMLIRKLGKLLNVHHRKRYQDILLEKTDRKTVNPVVFLNIELLDDAISQRKKVSFVYLEYGFDKKLKPRRKDKYTVSPYRMLHTNGHYYLVCRMKSEMPIALYRIDRMQDVALTDSESDAPISKAELDAAMHKTLFAWSGEPETIIMRCKNVILSDVIDQFGQSTRIDKETEDTFLAAVQAVGQGIFFLALQYLPYAEVLEPQWLRDEIIQSIQKNPYCEWK